MRDRNREPQRLGGEGTMARIARILAARGVDPATAEVHDAPEPIAALEAAEARIPLRYRNAVGDHPQVEAWVRSVALAAVAQNKGARLQVRTGPSLLLVGTTGTGKTYQAYGAVRSLVGAGIGARWHATTAADLYANLRPRPGVDTERELLTFSRLAEMTERVVLTGSDRRRGNTA